MTGRRNRWSKLTHGIRLDTNYYYWPGAWVQNRPGVFTGSGLPMRFAQLDGTLIDVYQATTQLTDESGQTYPFTIDTLLDRALGPEGYYGAFTVNAHNDSADNPVADAVIASAVARGIPVISAKQLLTWLDGRNGSSFSALTWNGTTLSFTVNVAPGATGLQAMVPIMPGQTITSLTRGGGAVPYVVGTVKGVSYAFVSALAGTYQVTFATDTTAPTVSTVSPAIGATGVATTTAVTVTFSEAVDPATISASTLELRTPTNALVPATVSYTAATTTATLTPSSALAANTTYTVTVQGGTTDPRVKDLAGNALATASHLQFHHGQRPHLPLQRVPSLGGAGHPGRFGHQCRRARDEVPGERPRHHHRDPVLQGGRQHRDPRGDPLDEHRDPARDRHLHQRDRLGLAAGHLPHPDPDPGQHHLCGVVPHHRGAVCGQQRLLRLGRRHRPPHGPGRWGGGRERGVPVRRGRFPDQTYNASNYWVDVVFGP